jgi:hypothetical protein
MPPSGMLIHVALLRSDVSEELIASFVRVKRMSELGTTLTVTSSEHRLLVTVKVVPISPSLVTLMMETVRSSETSVHTRATQHNIPEVEFFIVAAAKTSNHLKSYIALNRWTL